MNDSFVMVSMRLHMYEPGTLLCVGFFPEDNPKGKVLHVLIDGNEVETSVQVDESMEISRKYSIYRANVSKELTYAIKLPKEPVTSIVIQEETDGKRCQIYNATKGEIDDFMAGVAYAIDYVKKESDHIIIQGWAAVSPEAKFEVILDGESVPVEVTRSYRRDVIEIFKEADKSAELGFAVALADTDKRLAQLRITDKGHERNIPLDLQKTGDTVYGTPNNLPAKVFLYLKRNGFAATVRKVAARLTNKLPEDETLQYAKFLEQHPLTEETLEEQRQTKFTYNPVISIVIPIYNTPLDFLQELIDSVEAQTYPHWQLCLADGSDTNALEASVKEFSHNDERVLYKLLGYNDGISNNTNGAMEMATGEFIAFSDHDDLLTPDALYEVAKALNSDESIDCVYSDEDKIDMDGKTLFMPHFKPDFDMDLLCSYNYITHLFVARKSLIDQVGWLRSEYDGSQDHDMIIRCLEKARGVYHVPRVLYHWRCHKNSTAMNPESKMYCYESGRKAVQAHWDRMGVPATVEMASNYGHYITKYNWPEAPLVSIVIPNMNHKKELKTCIDSIVNKSGYQNYEILVVENNSTEQEIFDYYKELEENSKIRVVYYEGEFNYSRINNFGVKEAKGDYILLLNNDTELIASNSIKEMLDICMRDEVGAVGARLYYADNSIQHAGVILGVGGVANHAFYNTDRADVGYFFRSVSVQDYSAVTAACMMTKRSAFEEVGGLSEDLAVAFNDVDYCLKLRKAGKLVVFTPFSEWYHYESKSRGYENTPEKQQRLQKESDTFMSRWSDIIEAGDPYYNPNFNHKAADFAYDIEE